MKRCVHLITPYRLIVDAYRLSPRIESPGSPWDSIEEFDMMYGEKRIHRSGIILVEHSDIKRKLTSTYIHARMHTYINALHYITSHHITLHYIHAYKH